MKAQPDSSIKNGKEVRCEVFPHTRTSQWALNERNLQGTDFKAIQMVKKFLAFVEPEG